MSAQQRPEIRAVIFKLEDTLVPWHTAVHWQWAFRPRGPLLSERHTLAAIRRQLHLWDRRRWKGVTGAEPPTGPDEHRKFLSQTLDVVAGRSVPELEASAVVQRFLRPMPEVETYPDSVPVIREVSKPGLQLGAVTELPRETGEDLLKRAGLGTVRLVGSGDDSAHARVPLAAGFKAAVELLDVRPANTLLLGELFWSDVRAGGRAGLEAVLVDRRGWSPRVEWERWPDLRPLRDRLSGTPPTAPPGAPVLDAPPSGS